MAVSPSLYVALTWLFPSMLLVAALSRLVLPSFFYLLSFFYFILQAPLTLRHSPPLPTVNSPVSSPRSRSSALSSSSSHSHGRLCHYQYDRVYFLLHLVCPVVFLILPLVAQLLYRLHVSSFTPLTQLLGLLDLTASLTDTVHLLLPDLLFLAVAFATHFTLRSASQPPLSFSASRYERWAVLKGELAIDEETRAGVWDVAEFFVLLFAGIFYISFIALPYFLLWSLVLLHLSFQSYRYRHGHIRSSPSTPSSSASLSASSWNSLTHVHRLQRLSSSITALLPAIARPTLLFFTFYLPFHLTLLFAYQYLSLPLFHFRPSREAVNLLGLYSPTSVGWFMPPWTAYMGTVAQLAFLVGIGERRERAQRRAIGDKDDEDDESDEEVDEDFQERPHIAQLREDEAERKSMAGSSQSRYGGLGKSDLSVRLVSEEENYRQLVPKQAHFATTTAVSPPQPSSAAASQSQSPSSSPAAGQSPPPIAASSSPITHSRAIAVRHFLLRLSRYSGRFFCSLLLGITIFTLPSLLSILLLLMLVASLLTSSATFTRLAPYYLFFLLGASFILYIFSIPSLLPAIPALEWLSIIGLSHTHRPFVYVLDMIAPMMLFSAYLITYRLSLSSLTEESVLIAVSSGDEDMVKAAMRQQPPMLITHAKDERGRTLLHLAARYGQLSLILPLCRYIDVNAQDSDGKTALHFAYYYGYERVVKVLLFHPLVQPDIRDRFGQRALEQERSRLVQLTVQLRGVWQWLSDTFVSNAEKSALLLLYFVSTANVDGLHCVYLLFFLLFLSFPHVAERYWSILVVYCGLTLLALFSFSVLLTPPAAGEQPIIHLDDKTARWLGLFGFFVAKNYFVDLALYYCVFIVALVQWSVFERKESRRQERREQRRTERHRALSASHSRRDSGSMTPSTALTLPSFRLREERGETGADDGLLNATYFPVYVAATFTLAAFTLVGVALSDIAALFFFVYLLLFTVELLLVALGARYHPWVLLVFFALSTLVALLLVAVEYLYLCNALSEMLALLPSWLPPSVIGFHGAPHDETVVTWVMLPFIAVFVTQVWQLRAQWAALHREQKEAAEDEAADAQLRMLPELLHTPQRSVDLTPLTPRSPVGIRVDGRSSGEATPQSAPLLSSPGTSTPSSQPARVTPRYHRRRRRWSIAIEEAVYANEEEQRPSFFILLLSFLYSSLFSFLDRHAHHILALLLIVVITCVESISLVSMLYLLLLLVLCPFHQAYFLFVPTLGLAPLLLLTRYFYQLPPILSALLPHAPLLAWIGLVDYNGGILDGLYGDALVLFMASVQQLVGMERRRRMTEQAAEEVEDEGGEAGHGENGDVRPWLTYAGRDDENGAEQVEEGRRATPFIAQLPPSIEHNEAEEQEDDEEEEDETQESEPSPSPLPETTNLPRTASSLPSLSSSSIQPSSWSRAEWTMFLSALFLDLCSRFSRFASTFLARYCVQLALLFVLLTAAYRNNVLSLVYLLPVLTYITAGRQTLLVVWRPFLLLVALSILWQFVVLLAYAPFLPSGWHMPLSNHSGWQRWLLLGNFSGSAVVFDLLTYFFLSLQLAYLNQGDASDATRDAELERQRRQRWQKLGWQEAEEVRGGSGQLVTKTEQQYQDAVLKQEQREAVEEKEHPASTKSPASPFQPSAMSYSPSTLSAHRIMAQGAATVFPSAVFYLVLSMDKLFFLFVFAAATSHLDLLSLPYLFFSVYLLYANHLYTGDRTGLLRFYRSLHYYNFFVLACYLIYQLPVLCPPTPTGPLSPHWWQWQDVIGLRKFVCGDCDGVRCVDALSIDGALAPLLIFFLIDCQVLVLHSPLYERMAAYYDNARSLSKLRSRASTLHTQEQNKQRILSILSLRDSITASFTLVFQLASQLSGKYFEDETVWSTEKPNGWDQQVEQDLREQKKQEQVASEERRRREAEEGPTPDTDLSEEPEEHTDAVGVEEEKADKGQQEVEYEEVEHEKDELLRHNQAMQQRQGQQPDESALHYWRRLLRRWLIHHVDFTLYTRYTAESKSSEPVPAEPSVNYHHLSTLTLLNRFIVTQSQYLVFAAYLLALMLHPSLLSCIVPLSIFCYALIEYPRAPSAYFLLAFSYTFAVITAKFIFQLPLFCTRDTDRMYILAPSPLCAPPPLSSDDSIFYGFDYLVGIVKSVSSFFVLVLPELLCLLSVVWHRELCLERGVWLRDESQEDVVHPSVMQLLERYEASHGSPLTNLSPRSAAATPAAVPQPNLHASNRIHSWLDAVKLKLSYVFSFLPPWIQSYYRRLVPLQRLHGINVSKPGNDFFLLLFFIELTCAALILFNWNSMAATTTTAVSSFTTNLFSAQMVLILFVQTLIIVSERMIYNFRSISAKVALQYVTATFWLVLIVIVWPQWSERGVQTNPSLEVFLLLKLLYLFFSALQIYYGFPPVETTGFQDLTRHPGKYTVQLYKVYRAIPFVFELRTILDWMCTQTSLDLDETFKLEDIYTRLYLVQCALISRREHRRGDSRPWDEKLLNGAFFFFGLLLIIFTPMLLFSSANPVTQSNLVTGVAVELSLLGPRGEWTLFTISSLNTSGSVDDYTYGTLRQERLIDSNDKQEDIQAIQLTNFSDQLWTISPPALTALTNELLAPSDPATNNSYLSRLRYTFTRPLPATSPTISTVAETVLDPDKRLELAEFVSTDHGRTNMTLPSLVPTYYRLPASAAPIELTDKSNRSALTLAIITDNTTGATRWFQAYVPYQPDNPVPLCPQQPATTTDGGGDGGNSSSSGGCNLAFISISNRVFSGVFTNFSFSIVSLYSLILFTFGQFIRLLFSNLVARIPYDDIQNADRLLALVESIYVARWKKEMRMEEVLYRRLIKIMRTAPLLIELTKRDTAEEAGREAERRRVEQAEKERSEMEDEKRREAELAERKRRVTGRAGQQPARQQGSADTSQQPVQEEQQQADGSGGAEDEKEGKRADTSPVGAGGAVGMRQRR